MLLNSNKETDRQEQAFQGILRRQVLGSTPTIWAPHRKPVCRLLPIWEWELGMGGGGAEKKGREGTREKKEGDETGRNCVIWHNIQSEMPAMILAGTTKKGGDTWESKFVRYGKSEYQKHPSLPRLLTMPFEIYLRWNVHVQCTLIYSCFLFPLPSPPTLHACTSTLPSCSIFHSFISRSSRSRSVPVMPFNTAWCSMCWSDCLSLQPL